jgi:hypothetical protein
MLSPDKKPDIRSHTTVGVKVLNCALEERPNGDLILRGSIATESLANLKTDDYQREVLATGHGKKSRLRKGVEEGVTLPDIELGMRGENVSFKGTGAILNDPVFIIDGLQRVSALIVHMGDGGAGSITSTNPLGATIHFNSTKEWEKQRFADLNSLRTPVSPNVMLRNMRDKHPGVLTLYGLSHNDPAFALFRRVCWAQRMTKGELISASSMVRASTSLHRHVVERTSNLGPKATMGGDKSLTRAPAILDRIAKDIGLNNLRENIKSFYELMDACWGVRVVEFTAPQAHLRSNFITTLGSFLSRNSSLWTEESQRRLHVDSKTRHRLAVFPIADPEIRRLCSAGTMVLPTLYAYLLNHMNKGKSKHHYR